MLLATLLVCAASSVPPAQAEETVDVPQALRRVARRDLPLDERFEAASQVMVAEGKAEPEAWIRAGVALMPEGRPMACCLMLRGLETGWVSPETKKRALAALDQDAPAGDPATAATAWSLGRRTPEAAAVIGEVRDPYPSLVLPWFLNREAPAFLGDGWNPKAAQAYLVSTIPAADLLDGATSDDAMRVHDSLDKLVALGEKALPVLLHEAEIGAKGRVAGRMPRACAAILALGMLGSKDATPTLVKALRSTNGWVRAHAAQAMGDLGDPAGAVPLAEHLATLGDLHRARDSWDYPGPSGTTIPEAEWTTANYFAIDCAAADALLRLGVPRAAGYLIQEKLDPSKGNYRIRVFQDAVDALRRALPQASDLVKAYNVDEGLPQRNAAFMALANWWHAHRDDDGLLKTKLDETDAGFRKAARELVSRLTGKDVRQFMITKPACALLGTAVTPTLIETLEMSTRGAARAELAKTLGLVRDPRAVQPLLDLMKTDTRPFVRAAAAEALGEYAERAEVQAALLEALRDRKETVRVSAVYGLLGAPPTTAILDAVRAAAPKEPTGNHAMALAILLLLQEGDAHWPSVEKGLNATHRYERESWWGHVQRAFDLPDYVHDAAARPEAKQVRRLGLERVQDARKLRGAQ